MTSRERTNLAELDQADLLQIAFAHYDIAWPSGHGNRSIRCPVHDDRHASASVNTANGLWRCFACEQGGDAFNLVMIREGKNFADAYDYLRKLVDENGGEVRRRTTRKPGGLLSGRAGDRGGSKRYVPSWIRKGS